MIVTLEHCQAELVDPSDEETGRLLAILLLHLQTRLHRISDAELGDLCTALQLSGGKIGSVKPLRGRKN